MTPSPPRDHIRIVTWQDADRFAARAVPALSHRLETRRFQLLARRLLAAAARYVALTEPQPVPIHEVARVVRSELRVEPGEGRARPMSNCADTRVVQEAAAVREQGRVWVVAAGERNVAAWIALESLRRPP
jgi:hypothetical protein